MDFDAGRVNVAVFGNRVLGIRFYEVGFYIERYLSYNFQLDERTGMGVQCLLILPEILTPSVTFIALPLISDCFRLLYTDFRLSSDAK